MNNEHIKTIQSTSLFIGTIGTAIALLQNSEKLYIVSDYSIQTGNRYNEAILIPKELIEEFKQRLTSYYTEEYNKYVKELKAIEL